jgi:hypothetical protein
MPVTSLPLSDILNVTVVVSPAASPGPAFNQGHVVGSSAVIPSVGANNRVQQFTSLTAMSTAGFAPTAAEYLWADLYFGQSPAPSYLWVGRQDLTALAAVTPGSGGTNYEVGDVLTVVQSGGSFGQVKVTTVNSGGSPLSPGPVTGLAIIPDSQGTGYAVANGLNTTGGSGSGCTVNITAVGETPLQAVTACRNASPIWYACSFVGTASVAGIDSDLEAISAFIEGASPPSLHLLTTGEAAVLNGTAGNLLATLQAAHYRRTFSMYSTTQSGAWPNNVYASAAPMGLLMGANTGTPGSYYPLMFKPIAGVGYEPLTQTQVTAICGAVDRSTVGLNGNCYLNYQNGANAWIQMGVMAAGVFVDEVINLDVLASNIQVNGVVLLTSLPSIPLSDLGMTQMKNVFVTACQQSRSVGFVAQSGVWTGQQIGSGNAGIYPGQALPQGFAIYSNPVSQMSQAQRAARILPPVTVAVIEAGTGNSLTVTVNVQR